MIEYTSLTTRLFSNTMRHVQRELVPFSTLVVKNIAEHQIWALEDMVGKMLKKSAVQALREDSAPQRTANDFGLVHRMPLSLKTHIHELAKHDGHYLDYQAYAEICWSQEKMKAAAAGKYFRQNKGNYYQNAIVFYFLLYAILDGAHAYLFPEFKKNVLLLQTDFPEPKWQ